MGGIVIIKKFYAYITGKTVKQRICICIVLTVMLTFAFFFVKANFFDKPNSPPVISEYSKNSDSADGNAAENYEPTIFHISLIDTGVLLAVIAAYSVHKIREKKRQGRL